jgi:hypothetical protein
LEVAMSGFDQGLSHEGNVDAVNTATTFMETFGKTPFVQKRSRRADYKTVGRSQPWRCHFGLHCCRGSGSGT